MDLMYLFRTVVEQYNKSDSKLVTSIIPRRQLIFRSFISTKFHFELFATRCTNYTDQQNLFTGSTRGEA